MIYKFSFTFLDTSIYSFHMYSLNPNIKSVYAIHPTLILSQLPMTIIKLLCNALKNYSAAHPPNE